MKKLILFVAFVVISFAGYSQTQQTEKKTHYQTEDKLYWNKALPIYISLSSPDLEDVKLNKPFYLDTEGVNYLRTKWEMDETGKYVHPLKEQVWEIYADGQSPKTSVTFLAEESYTYKGKKYYSDDLKVELSAEDKLSGVQKIYYSINGDNFKIYENFIKFNAGLDITLKFYSVDNVGNVEDVGEISYDYDNNALAFGIDDLPPNTTTVDSSKTLSPRDVIELISEDSGVGVNSIQYRFNDTEYMDYTSPIKLNQLDDGEYTLFYFGLDWINNQEGEKEYSFYLDANAPEITVIEEIIKDGLTNLRYITLNVVDNYSGVDKVLVQLKEGMEYAEYNKPFYVDITHQQIKIKAIDMMGNETTRIIEYNEIR